MIVDAYGRATTKHTETKFDPRLVKALMDLSDLLQQNGLGLICVRCNRLGLPDGVTANNRPASDTYRLVCSCSTRIFNKKSGAEKVAVQ